MHAKRYIYNLQLAKDRNQSFEKEGVMLNLTPEEEAGLFYEQFVKSTQNRKVCFIERARIGPYAGSQLRINDVILKELSEDKSDIFHKVNCVMFLQLGMVTATGLQYAFPSATQFHFENCYEVTYELLVDLLESRLEDFPKYAPRLEIRYGWPDSDKSHLVYRRLPENIGNILLGNGQSDNDRQFREKSLQDQTWELVRQYRHHCKNEKCSTCGIPSFINVDKQLLPAIYVPKRKDPNKLVEITHCSGSSFYQTNLRSDRPHGIDLKLGVDGNWMLKNQESAFGFVFITHAVSRLNVSLFPGLPLPGNGTRRWIVDTYDSASGKQGCRDKWENPRLGYSFESYLYRHDYPNAIFDGNVLKLLLESYEREFPELFEPVVPREAEKFERRPAPVSPVSPTYDPVSDSDSDVEMIEKPPANKRRGPNRHARTVKRPHAGIQTSRKKR